MNVTGGNQSAESTGHTENSRRPSYVQHVQDLRRGSTTSRHRNLKKYTRKVKHRGQQVS
jgi:hypothetical protein